MGSNKPIGHLDVIHVSPILSIALDPGYGGVNEARLRRCSPSAILEVLDAIWLHLILRQTGRDG